MTYRNLTIAELKSLYSTRPGFIFQGNTPSSRSSCEKLSKVIKEQKCCDYEPDFIVELDPATYVFVYPEGASFKSAAFYEFAQEASMMTAGMYRLDILTAFLKVN
jgi:hypothetical protein